MRHVNTIYGHKSSFLACFEMIHTWWVPIRTHPKQVMSSTKALPTGSCHARAGGVPFDALPLLILAATPLGIYFYLCGGWVSVGSSTAAAGTAVRT